MKKIYLREKQISIIGNGFEKDIGQGVNKCCGYLYDGLKSNNNINKVEIPSDESKSSMFYWSSLGVFKKTFMLKSSLYHYTIPNMAWTSIIKRPSIVTFYDVIPLILKNERKLSYNLYFKFMAWFSKRANHIIAISESTKQDLIRLLNVPKERITVIYPGVDHKIFYPKETQKNKRFTVGFLGGLVKRKNAGILLDVARLLPEIDFKIGGSGLGFMELMKKRDRMNLKNVKLMGFIPNEELNNFYNSLDVFIAPTIYDGFCMPGLEAMSAGTPVILSDRSAHLEVVGKAGTTINPKSVIEIVETILKIKDDDDIQIKMGKECLEHSMNFSWEKNIKETYELYERIMNG